MTKILVVILFAGFISTLASPVPQPPDESATDTILTRVIRSPGPSPDPNYGWGGYYGRGWNGNYGNGYGYGYGNRYRGYGGDSWGGRSTGYGGYGLYDLLYI